MFLLKFNKQTKNHFKTKSTLNTIEKPGGKHNLTININAQQAILNA